MQLFRKLSRERIIQIFVVLGLIVFILPAKAERRLVRLVRTSIVVPSVDEGIDYIAFYRKYERLIVQASEEFDVPAPLIAAVIKAESSFDPYAVSPAGAMGMMQLMPRTWAYLGGMGSPFNAGLNIKLGTKYLRELLDQFRWNLRLAIAAYNAGPGAVRRYRRIPPYRETRRYVPRVLAFYRKFKKFG